MKNIAEIIKAARNEKGLSTQYVVDELSKYNISISETTLYGYENGVSKPSANTLMALCVIYGIDNVLSTFGFQVDESQQERLSGEAMEIASLYDLATNLQKDIVKTTLEYPAKKGKSASKDEKTFPAMEIAAELMEHTDQIFRTNKPDK